MSDTENYYSDDDNVSSPLLGSRVTQTPYVNGAIHEAEPAAILEPPDTYKSRWRSIRIMYLTMFLGSATFTITISSIWPFLQILNPTVSESFLGWVVASYSVGQLVASPLFGAWSNFRGSSREPLLVSLFLTVVFNVMYMYLQSMPSHSDVYMIMARGLIGFSAGNVAVVRSYLSAATTLQERTSCMANVSIFQALGFILGPLIQACLVPIGYPGPVESPGFHFNMYTAPAVFAALLGMVNFLLLVFVFKEHRTDDLEDAIKSIDPIQGVGDSMNKDGDEEKRLLDSTQSTIQPDMVAVISAIYIFFVALFIFTVFETIGTPLTMHMYAWTKSEATLYQGFILGMAAFTSIVVAIIIKILVKKYSEKLLIFFGLVFCSLAFVVFLPWGSKLPPQGYAPLSNSSRPPVGLAPAFSELIEFLSSWEYSRDSSSPAWNESTPFSVYSSAHNHHAHVDQSYSGVNNDIGYKTFPEYSRNVEASSKTFKNRNDKITVMLIESNTTSTSIHTDPPTTVTTGPHNTTTGPLNTTTGPLNTATGSRTTTTGPPTTATGPLTTTTALLTTTTGLLTTTGPPIRNHSVGPEGCPWNYAWCRHVPQVRLGQYLSGTLMISIGYPTCQMLTYTVYSKILGPKPQGVWMGWLTAAGSFARTVGPIYVSQVYNLKGPRVTFASIAGFVFITIIFYVFVFRRLVPYQEYLNRGRQSPML